MTPAQKKWTGIAAGILIIGAVAAHKSDSGNLVNGGAITVPFLPCHPQPDGTCRQGFNTPSTNASGTGGGLTTPTT
jgi:hypothetical protein